MKNKFHEANCAEGMAKNMQIRYNSPIGMLIITENDGFIAEIKFAAEGESPPSAATPVAKASVVLQQCVRELDAYFAGNLCEFSVPVRASGTVFREGVWEELKKIPFGETISYKELARRTGNPAAIRAVGGANHHNPICILIPCHRVIGSDGSLTGYGGGLWRKEFLLKLEKHVQ